MGNWSIIRLHSLAALTDLVIPRNSIVDYGYAGTVPKYAVFLCDSPKHPLNSINHHALGSIGTFTCLPGLEGPGLC